MKKTVQLISGTCITTLMIILIIGIFFQTNEIQGAMTTPNKTYKTIIIKKEDTLWNIASEYMDENYYNYDTYISEVVSINQMKDTTIYSGETMVIPIINN